MGSEDILWVSVESFINQFLSSTLQGKTLDGLGKELIGYIIQQHSGACCRAIRAEDASGRRHLLVDVVMIVDLIRHMEKTKRLPADIDFGGLVLFFSNSNSIDYKSIVSVCCCREKKLLSAWYQVTSINEIIDNGSPMINKFNALLPSLKTILCLDIEGTNILTCVFIFHLVYESNHSLILEIGYTLYDKSSQSMSCSHFIIKENLCVRNGKYCPDRREHFNFGKSELIGLDAAIDRLRHLLAVQDLCLVGHNIAADINYLKSHINLRSNLHIFDTQTTFKHLELSLTNSNLENILKSYSIDYSNLHNAGNDAYYTLAAFLKMVQLPCLN